MLSGLPGVGKSTLARELARDLGAVWLRIDSIEQGIRASGVVTGSLDDSGYRVAHAVAADNLRLGHTVVADCVNPWDITRESWRDMGLAAGAAVIEVELVCSDSAEHRERLENRTDAPLRWEDVASRDYRPWRRQPVRIDTAGRSVAESVDDLRAALARG